MNNTNNLTGQIIEVQKNLYTLRYNNKEISAKLKGLLLKQLTKEENMPIIGDFVSFSLTEFNDAIITSLLPRKSIFEKPDQRGHTLGYVKTMKSQKLAANFDYAFIVTSLNSNFNVNRVVRYITITTQGHGIPVVILSKADLYPDYQKKIDEIHYYVKNVDIIAVSSITHWRLKNLIPYFENNNTILLLGSSGVGKSTLINALFNKEVMKTGAIREKDDKGKHTTTYRRMFSLPNGSTIIDTPGIREVGTMDDEDGIKDTFDDIVSLSTKCRFSNCTHTSEPGCAITQALEDGTLSKDRYLLFKSLIKENKNNARLTVQQKRKR